MDIRQFFACKKAQLLDNDGIELSSKAISGFNIPAGWALSQNSRSYDKAQ
jgi:hypothetical protein